MTEGSTTPLIAETSPQPAWTGQAGILRTCPECGGTFSLPTKGPGRHKRYCNETCRRAWQYREKVEGSAAITILKIWAGNRRGGACADVGNLAFARLRELGDYLNDNDKREGRLQLKANGPLDKFIKAVLAEPYIDRKRR